MGPLVEMRISGHQCEEFALTARPRLASSHSVESVLDGPAVIRTSVPHIASEGDKIAKRAQLMDDAIFELSGMLVGHVDGPRSVSIDSTG